MSDVRTLLKAKRQDIRVDHPLASYTSSGHLRCAVCETNIKHASSWDGHLGSKVHRTNAARAKEERKRRELAVEEEAQQLKRKAAEDDVDNAKNTTKKSRITAPQPLPSNWPSSFFSDSSRAPLHSSNDSDDDEEAEGAMTVTASVPGPGGTDSTLDQEWIQFRQTVINAADSTATYDRATIVVEPELVSNPSEGLPIHNSAPAQPVAQSGEDERRRKEQDERELIMDRLMDEERAQEEADMKVTVMKTKLEALRKRREATRSAKPNLVGVA